MSTQDNNRDESQPGLFDLPEQPHHQTRRIIPMWSHTTLKRDCVDCVMAQQQAHSVRKHIPMRVPASVRYRNGTIERFLCNAHAMGRGWHGRA